MYFNFVFDMYLQTWRLGMMPTQTPKRSVLSNRSDSKSLWLLSRNTLPRRGRIYAFDVGVADDIQEQVKAGAFREEDATDSSEKLYIPQASDSNALEEEGGRAVVL